MDRAPTAPVQSPPTELLDQTENHVERIPNQTPQLVERAPMNDNYEEELDKLKWKS